METTVRTVHATVQASPRLEAWLQQAARWLQRRREQRDLEDLLALASEYQPRQSGFADDLREAVLRAPRHNGPTPR